VEDEAVRLEQPAIKGYLLLQRPQFITPEDLTAEPARGPVQADRPGQRFDQFEVSHARAHGKGPTAGQTARRPSPAPARQPPRVGGSPGHRRPRNPGPGVSQRRSISVYSPR